MSMINAALVESFDEPPHVRTIPAPEAAVGQEVVDVLAVGVHPATRGIAAGKHYTSPKNLPVPAGADAVVRRADGSLAFVMPMGAGTLAERIVIDPATAIPVPDGTDPAVLAATMNPALSSWTALRTRVPFEAGDSVLVHGATGNAGSTAVKVARHLGAGRVIAAGRNRSRLDDLQAEGVDAVVRLTPDEEATAAALAEAAAEVDVVLDYVWGPPTELAMRAVLGARTQHTRVLDWVQIGGMGGDALTLSGHALRSNAFRILGSGFGSVEMDVMQREFTELVAAIAAGGMIVRPRPFSLADVEKAWAHQDAPGERTVILL
ncbi:zinc-binding alcohol dehydrogenase family protein [Streptomyces sp. TRM66268-LWL]|uniref:Zinc-binding alcohol dehydrogenase family protein n=1 Tax=Streptomyces polyasparticus TaxID=2767826 RepID=A0ABR7SIS7_9ACTN|nr:zinc-binding alcohol dehydrogenase family protein [Streptomyces polyasparticus]MBC9715159.1 zinc-binding alcohol dehydrogenase family protein [Streptomyces polyasparticus]